jgi:hypothetical protein
MYIEDLHDLTDEQEYALMCQEEHERIEQQIAREELGIPEPYIQDLPF